MTSEYCNLLIVLVLVGYLFYMSFTSEINDQKHLEKIKYEMLENSEQYFAESANLYRAFNKNRNKTIIEYWRTHSISLRCAEIVVLERVNIFKHSAEH